jgi:hypothetical protein
MIATTVSDVGMTNSFRPPSVKPGSRGFFPIPATFRSSVASSGSEGLNAAAGGVHRPGS